MQTPLIINLNNEKKAKTAFAKLLSAGIASLTKFSTPMLDEKIPKIYMEKHFSALKQNDLKKCHQD